MGLADDEEADGAADDACADGSAAPETDEELVDGAAVDDLA